MANYPELTFKYGWNDKDEVETPMKGYRSDGIFPAAIPVRLGNLLTAEGLD